MKKVKSYYELDSLAHSHSMGNVLDDIYEIERKESHWSADLRKPQKVQERLLGWYNEKGAKADISMQRPSYVLMTEFKKAMRCKLRKVS